MNSECYFHGKWLITVIVVNQNDDASASHFLRLKLFEAPTKESLSTKLCSGVFFRRISHKMQIYQSKPFNISYMHFL